MRSRLLRGRALAAWAGGFLALTAAAACGSGGGAATTSNTGSSSSGSGGGSSSSSGAPARPMDPPVTVDLQGRPYDIFLPPNLDPTKPAPLFLELHGFTSKTSDPMPWAGEEMANLFVPEAQKRGIIAVTPHGSFDPTLNHFYWNATDSCCDIAGTNPNDIGYLMAVIQDVSSKYKVDPKRIFVFGHSNGGFMVNRMACDQADKIAGVVSLAGETYLDQTLCAASAPIAFLQVQGNADMTVPYDGGHPEGIATQPVAPGAVQTTQDWATKNLCNLTPDTSQPSITLMTSSTSPDTFKTVYTQCEGNGDTELWTIQGGPHSPSFTSAWAPAVFDFLLAHPKP